LLSAPVLSHDADLPVNPLLGVPGFPDCVRAHPDAELDVEDAANDLVCHQKSASKDAIRIGMIGDSITAGVCSSGGDHPYPSQLQILLDKAYGEGVYSVTNMGACGATMLKSGDMPYWSKRQYRTLTSNKWDIIAIMLGTNDAKDPESGKWNNWHHDCSDSHGAHTAGCQFAQYYNDMIDVVRTLGTTDGVEPKVYAMIPPPLMQDKAYGMNQTVINTVLPELIPLISSENHLTGTIDVFSGLGGVKNWESSFPDTCAQDSSWAPCSWWCDKQSCNQCHPNDSGYAQLATVVQAGLGLTGPSFTV
jgi:lysophospholipase L1-like esterase